MPAVRTLILLAALAGPLRADDLAGLSDNFNHAPSIYNWNRYHTLYGLPDQAITLDINQASPDALHIEPEVSSWFEDYRAPFLYKEITGDFIATTRVQVTSLAGGTPQADYTLAGLMVRAPDPTPDSWQPGEANWLFVSTGMGTGGQRQFETKNTIDSESNLILTPAASGWIRLRIERSGATFRLLGRIPGEDWQLLRVLDRPDMPATVQVGLEAYTDWPSCSAHPGDAEAFNATIVPSPPGNRDMIARFDWIRFRRPNGDGDNRLRAPIGDGVN